MSTTSTKLSWTCPVGNYDDLLIYRATNENFTEGLTSTVLSPGNTSYLFTGLTTGTTYYYQVYSRVKKFDNTSQRIVTQSDILIDFSGYLLFTILIFFILYLINKVKSHRSR